MAKFTDNLWESIRLEAERRWGRQDPDYEYKSLEYYCAQVAYEYSENGFVR